MSKCCPHLLYVITEDWFFWSHFRARAVSARRAGYRVTVCTRVSRYGAAIEALGLELIAFDFDRHGCNPLREWRTIGKLSAIYRRVQPDIIHQIALKPILYGGCASLFNQRVQIINAPVGMGFVFSSQQRLARLLRPLISLGLRLLLNPPHSRVVFENRDDLQAAVRKRLVRTKDAVLIPGAGVDLREFQCSIPGAAKHHDAPWVIVVARMLWDKGIGEFVAAAQKLRRQGIRARFVLVGAPDPGNPAAIPGSQLDAWHHAGIIDWLGPRHDIPALLSRSRIACLPSYREGLPKALLEAMAAGLPLVTTDVPGCRELVTPNVNGLLVPPRDADRLAQALARLLADRGLCERFGKINRKLVAAHFATEHIEQATLALFLKT